MQSFRFGPLLYAMRFRIACGIGFFLFLSERVRTNGPNRIEKTWENRSSLHFIIPIKCFFYLPTLCIVPFPFIFAIQICFLFRCLFLSYSKKIILLSGMHCAYLISIHFIVACFKCMQRKLSYHRPSSIIPTGFPFIT